jgi:hypothetical protein
MVELFSPYLVFQPHGISVGIPSLKVALAFVLPTPPGFIPHSLSADACRSIGGMGFEKHGSVIPILRHKSKSLIIDELPAFYE